ncbi:hypothetical protein GCM10023222_35390 [Saccharopolyspora cebuensis]
MCPMSTTDPKPPIPDSELTEILCRELTSAAPSDWEQISLLYRASTTICQAELDTVARDGRQILVGLPGIAHEIMRELRKNMAHPTRGAWFSVELTLARDHGSAINFNYDHDPEWSPPVDPKVYELDFIAFPRTLECTPAWLSAIITPSE